MKKRIFSIISILLVAATAMSCATLSAFAKSDSSDDDANKFTAKFKDLDYGCNVKTESDTVLLVNLDTGVTVYSKAADKKRYPASLTKIMTYVVVAENVEDFSKKVEVKQSVIDELVGTGSSLSGASEFVGKKITVEQLLQCMMIESGNDAALVLADYVGGKSGVKGFVKMMNAKAKELGCTNTHFVNPHGLHNKDHYTTANDLYKITSYALTLPEFSKITNSTSYEIGDYYGSSTNHMLDSTDTTYYYKYARGIKTGTTDEAGRCLVTMAVADGYSYLAVLMHAPYVDDETYGTMTDAAELFRWAFRNIELREIVSKETPICEEKVNLSWDKSSIQLCPENDYNALLTEDVSDSDITITTNVPSSINAPVNQGDYVGTADVYYKDEKVATFRLLADEKVERSTLLYVFDILQSVFTSMYFIGAAIIVVVLFIIYLFVVVKHNKNAKKRKRQVKHYRDM
ncbi:MAG: D-alanyl-D-alanine carboxypeptidase [Ruminococcus sp.]|nr:D-alanyl-D-alanine carboxypeptidase [Ruminococcus sp.]